MSNQNSSGQLNLNNDEVYYSNEAGWQYMSVSQYKDFLECEGRALAKLKDEWKPEKDQTALIVGNYLHSYFESDQAHKEFKEKYQDQLYKKDGKLYKAYEVAEQMIKRVEKDDLFNYLWTGEHEEVVTGELFGVNWKGKIDLLNVEKGYFIDLKTTAMLDKRFWVDDFNEYRSFPFAYGYDIQMAVYEQLLDQKYDKSFTGYIYAVTKQEPPNISMFEFDNQDKEIALDLVGQRIDRVEKVKTGQEAPNLCGKCEYCREHKQLTNIINAKELIY